MSEFAATTEPSEPKVAGRRDLLRLAGAAAAGMVATTIVAGGQAHAADGNSLVIGQSNAGTALTELTGSALRVSTSGAVPAIEAVGNQAGVIGLKGSSNGGAGVQGVAGVAPVSVISGTGVDGQGSAAGVVGYSPSGTGVTGFSDASSGVEAISTTSTDLRCSGTGRLWLIEHTTEGPPTAGTYVAGEVIRDAAGSFWVCVAGDDTDVGTWRKIGGASTAGALHAISPARVYDSRKTMTPMANGVLGTGASRLITVKDQRDPDTGAVTTVDVVPAGATAVMFNMTVAATAGASGNLAINPGTDAVAHASHINWFGAGQAHANAGMIGLDASRQVTVICGGPAGAGTHFIIDITGYYL
ncbi:MAG: hypothetical protein Q7V88_06935 [Actinomycetota bacterium]|nr:hypothetical protein [Actinomycetota bacterium]